MLNSHSLHYDIGPWDSNTTLQTFNLKYNEQAKKLYFGREASTTKNEKIH